MFAVATPNPDSPAETYVRQHIRLIAPGHTAVLFFEGNGVVVSRLPHLKTGQFARGSARSTLEKAWNLLFHGYTGSISGQEMNRVSRFLGENSVCSILAEFGPTGCALRHLCKSSGIRLYVNFHGHDATVMARRWQTRRSYRWLANDANGFICGSKYFSGVLESLGLPKSKIHVVPCGIEASEFNHEAEKDPSLVVAVGRFVEKKAPDLTIEAFARVCRIRPTARLEMIGDGPLLARCRAIAKKLGLEDSVVFHGACDHSFVKDKLAQASIFVQHSVRAKNGDMESQGISLLEAMACAAPVVTTRHNGFVETVLDSETGFLVDEFDMSGMVNRVLELLADDGKRVAFGRNGRQRVVEHYDANILAGRLREILGV